MRKIKAIFALTCMIVMTAAAEADRLHLPCDANLAVSVGTGIFSGRTHQQEYGDIRFERIQPTFLRLEAMVFENCKSDGKDEDKDPEVTRRWFGRLNIYGMVTPEVSTLGFKNKPKYKFDEYDNPVWRTDENGNPILDENGQMVQATENSLLKASLETDTDFSGGVGARLSIYDHPHFHLEAYGEYTGSFSWNRTNADSIVVRALELDLDVAETIGPRADINYKWSMKNIGVTIAVPLRPNTVDRNRLTPFLSFGRMRFNADVDIKLDAEATSSLEALGVNVESIIKRRTIERDSWLAFLGARLDFNRSFSLEAGAAFWKTDSTTVYWFSGSAALRFDYPWKRGR